MPTAGHGGLTQVDAKHPGDTLTPVVATLTLGWSPVPGLRARSRGVACHPAAIRGASGVASDMFISELPSAGRESSVNIYPS